MNTPILWQRVKNPLYPAVYHLPYDDRKCGTDWHYFPTACRKEIKGHYWEIAENPDKKLCCKECLKLYEVVKCRSM